MFFVGRELVGPRAGLFVGLAAALSPPLFQFGRIAWDPPLMAGLLVWGLYVLLRARTPWTGALAGTLFGLCMYAYPAGSGHHYFTRYARKAQRRFDSPIKKDALEARASGDWDRFLDARRGYGPVSLRYYLMHYGGDTCSSSRERLRVRGQT